MSDWAEVVLVRESHGVVWFHIVLQLLPALFHRRRFAAAAFSKFVAEFAPSRPVGPAFPFAVSPHADAGDDADDLSRRSSLRPQLTERFPLRSCSSGSVRSVGWSARERGLALFLGFCVAIAVVVAGPSASGWFLLWPLGVRFMDGVRPASSDDG